MAFLGLNTSDKKQLEFEIVPYNARLQLTRLLRASVESVEDMNMNTWVVHINSIVNICRNVLALPISFVEVNDWGDYEHYDAAWLRAELEVAMRRPNSTELIETLADLVQSGWADARDINDILSANGVQVTIEMLRGSVKVAIVPTSEILEDNEVELPNIRLLIRRMETTLENSDYAGVLHASASVFETLAKDVFSNPNVQNQSLASFFDGYKKTSRLPEPVLTYIREIYDRRNIEPLAGHGHTEPPSVTQEEAITLVEMTKALVKIERKLQLVSITPPKARS